MPIRVNDFPLYLPWALLMTGESAREEILEDKPGCLSSPLNGSAENHGIMENHAVPRAGTGARMHHRPQGRDQAAAPLILKKSLIARSLSPQILFSHS